MKLLVRKYLESKTSVSEEEMLYVWLQKDKKNINIFKDEMSLFMFIQSKEDSMDPQIAFEEFKFTIEKKSNKPVKFLNYKSYYKYVAILIVIISSTYFIKTSFTPDQESVNTSSININKEVSNQIILVRGDGTEEELKNEQEELSYINEASTEESLVYNEIKIPKGQIFKLVLSDSTVVWLNASTKLKYPKKFINSQTTRTVELEGEAYFEVAHNPNKPFIVNTNGVNVKVLGTKFNVSSYPNETNISTTLVEGSVKVRYSNENETIIKPNDQASFNKNTQFLSTKKVNTANFTSWIHKTIIFNDMRFEKLALIIERAYNVEVLFENEVLKNEYFTGQFDVETIDTIFQVLSTSINFDYEINGTKITIKNNLNGNTNN